MAGRSKSIQAPTDAERQEVFEAKTPRTRAVAQDRLRTTLRDARLVVAGHAAGEPRMLLRLLAEVAQPGLRLLTGFAFDGSPIPELADRTAMRIETWHPTRLTRALLKSGRVGYLPLRSSELPAVLRVLRPDLALVVASPPGPDGNLSFGASAGHSATFARAARQVLVEVNPEMPVTRGEPGLEPESVALTVEAEEALPVYAPAEPDAIARQVATNVLPLLSDGSRIQLGIGSVPEAVAEMLADGAGPRGISFFGMGLDAMADAIKNGVTARTGSLLISPDLVGRRIWNLAASEPRLLVQGAEQSYNPLRLAAAGALISVNSALAVDLSGQVAVERLDGELVSGLGGAFDFALAANLSRDGLSIVALPSTARQSRISRIVRQFGPGTSVSIPSHVPDYLVTEFGAARVRGLTADERREAIAGLAHPHHRPGLMAFTRAAPS